MQPRPSSSATTAASAASAATGYVKKKTSQILRAVTPSSARSGAATPDLPPALEKLVDAYTKSDVAHEVRAECTEGAGGAGSGDVLGAEGLKSRKRATYLRQFTILSGRTFKNLYRDPALLATHYISAFILARKCLWSQSLVGRWADTLGWHSGGGLPVL